MNYIFSATAKNQENLITFFNDNDFVQKKADIIQNIYMSTLKSYINNIGIKPPICGYLAEIDNIVNTTDIEPLDQIFGDIPPQLKEYEYAIIDYRHLEVTLRKRGKLAKV